MLQGSRQAHVKAIESAAEKAGANVNIREVRTPGDLLEPKLHAIILPGGESTTMRKVGGGWYESPRRDFQDAQGEA